MRCLHCTMIFLIRNSHFDLTYLRDCEPSNLVKVKGTKNVYCTAEHDSLKISNGKWYWWSRGFGGVSALDYLMKVRGFGFVESIEILTGREFSYVPPTEDLAGTSVWMLREVTSGIRSDFWQIMA